MKRYFKPVASNNPSSPLKETEGSSKRSKVEKNLANSSEPSLILPPPPVLDPTLSNLPADPGLRFPIMKYVPNIRDQVRRAYMLKGPCQPRQHVFSFKTFGKKQRRFVSGWFDEYPNWLEYSVSKDAAFCLYCYLFKAGTGVDTGEDCFVSVGFSNWKKKDRFRVHVGPPDSDHNKARISCEALLNQNQHIATHLEKQSQQVRSAYRIRLGASVKCTRHLLHQGLPFRGHDESKDSSNRGNFLELLKFLRENNEDIKAVTLENAPQNEQMVAHEIQKQIVNCASVEVLNSIMRDVGDSLFSILVDESRDISTKEQMAIVLRYVEDGRIIERFVGIEHVTDTSAVSLKSAIDEFFSRNGLSISSLRGQGYDGASNMQGQFNGLKTLILKENKCAFYVHCFAHQLQLALIAVAKKHIEVVSLFAMIANIVNVVGASAKRCDMLREKQAVVVIEAINKGEISSGQGLNQEIGLKRSGDTRWGSHYYTLINFILLFQSIVFILDWISKKGSSSDQKYEALVLLESIETFDFVFSLHFMKAILGITNDLSQALQLKDQNIVNAMELVGICKRRLQVMRENGWDSLFNEVSPFSRKYDVQVPDMDAIYLPPGRRRRKTYDVTNMHHYRFEVLCNVIDTQTSELDDRFDEISTELLLCLACLSPRNVFSAFNKQKLIRMAQFYPKDFSAVQITALEDQLENYIVDMRSSTKFSGLKGIDDLARKMFETRKDKTYPLVYLLLTLALILPVATATVERVFSAMNIVKTRLRNRMGDRWMNDSLIVYIEKDIFDAIQNEIIMKRFQDMQNRRNTL